MKAREIYKDNLIDISLILPCIIAGIVVSCYFFPFEFTFLPKGLNTKMMLAVFGILWYSIHTIRTGKQQVDRDVFVAIVIAIVFSLEGWISVDINHSSDYSYANYFISAGTWLGAAYTTYRILFSVHGYVDFRLLMHYLIAICVIQCGLAIAIDLSEPLKFWINRFISQDTVASVEFLEKVDRLYGIGAAVDVAGTRFSVILLGIAALLIQELNERRSTFTMVVYWISFIIIVGVGNMISRTTTVGMMMAFVYLLLGSGILSRTIQSSTLTLWNVFLFSTAVLFIVGAYFYHTDESLKSLIRFGFEGFFNLAEKGEWKTDSTERLNGVMWIWPDYEDWRTWIIGKADFSWDGTLTDIGYCRFVFYNGLVGLVTFSLFFVHNAWACAKRFPDQKMFFLFLFVLGFVVWLKVATDLFMVYALFYCFNQENNAISEREFEKKKNLSIMNK